MDFDLILKRSNDKYFKEKLEKIRTYYKKNKFLPLFNIPLPTSDETTLCGCSRENTFMLTGMPLSNFTIHKYEKYLKDDFILKTSLEKLHLYLSSIKKFYIKSSKDKDNVVLVSSVKEDTFRYFSNFILTKNINDKETTLFLFDLITKKESKEQLAVNKYLSTVVFLFYIYKFNNIVVIPKNVFTGEEISIKFSRVHFNSIDYISIDGKTTSFEIKKYFDYIYEELKEIQNKVENKEFSEKKNSERCSTCNYVDLCLTL